jgi:hypothetical protein
VSLKRDARVDYVHAQVARDPFELDVRLGMAFPNVPQFAETWEAECPGPSFGGGCPTDIGCGTNNDCPTGWGLYASRGPVSAPRRELAAGRFATPAELASSRPAKPARDRPASRPARPAPDRPAKPAGPVLDRPVGLAPVRNSAPAQPNCKPTVSRSTRV